MHVSRRGYTLDLSDEIEQSTRVDISNLGEIKEKLNVVTSGFVRPVAC